MSYTSHDISGFDFVHHWVGSAKVSAHYYASLFGFRIVGYLGPETGVRDRVSYILNQNDLTFVISSPLLPDHEIQEFVKAHGDGVHEVTLRTKDPAAAMTFAAANGARVVREVQSQTDEQGTFVSGTIALYGDTVLTFLNRDQYRGTLPGYQPYDGPQFCGKDCTLLNVDHIVGNVDSGKMNYWAEFFERCLDFETYIHFDEGDISTQYSALVSKVVRSKNSAVKFPINEPAEGLKKSQIEEYLEVNYGSGVQHIAISSSNILNSIDTLGRNGVCFIPTPASYYDVVADRVSIMDEDLETVKKLSILIDREGDGYLLQLFTQPLSDRPTLFFEIIQRKGSDGFGQNNFQSLFESIEREQEKRGNL